MIILSRSQRYEIQKRPRSTPKQSSKINVLDNIQFQNAKIESLLSQRLVNPYFVDGTNSFNINTGSVFNGFLLNSIVSSNLASPLLIMSSDRKIFPTGVKFDCHGQAQKNRILVSCESIIIQDNQYEVVVEILNMDGSAGLVGEIYTGDEQYIIATGAMDIISEATNLTNSASPLMHGILKAAESTTNFARSKIQNEATPTIYVKAGMPVLIYFKKAFKL